MTLPRKFVAKTPKKSRQKSRKIFFLAEIFDIFNYIRIARQFKNDIHYSNLHFGHLEIFQQRFFMQNMCFSHSLLLQLFFRCLS
jgi:hypothetical protein